MDSHRNVDNWLAEIATRPRVFNHNLHLRAGTFKGFDLVNTVTMDAPHGATETVYLYARRKGKGAADEVLRVGISAHDDTRLALLALGQALDQCMNPDLPRAAGKLGKLADIGFAVRGEHDGKGLGAASFNVGNVTVTVHSVGAAGIDVAPAAAQLGQWLARVPDDNARRAGLVTAFAPPSVRLQVGQALTLVEQLPESRADAPRIQVLARGGELRREGAALVFVAGDGGAQDVALYSHAAQVF